MEKQRGWMASLHWKEISTKSNLWKKKSNNEGDKDQEGNQEARRESKLSVARPLVGPHLPLDFPYGVAQEEHKI